MFATKQVSMKQLIMITIKGYSKVATCKFNPKRVIYKGLIESAMSIFFLMSLKCH